MYKNFRRFSKFFKNFNNFPFFFKMKKSKNEKQMKVKKNIIFFFVFDIPLGFCIELIMHFFFLMNSGFFSEIEIFSAVSNEFALLYFIRYSL